MTMRKIAWIFTLILLITAALLVVARQAMSPHLAPNTPAKQGGLHLESISVGKRSFQRGYAFFKDTRCIVLRVKETRADIRPLSPPIVFYVVTPHGFSEMLPEAAAAAPRPVIQTGGEDVVPHELCVPLGYPDSVSYLDIVAREYPVRGKEIARWRLVNLPRSVHAIKPPVQLQDTYRCEDFEMRLEVVSEKNPPEWVVTDFGESLLLHEHFRILHPGNDLHLHLRFVRETPEWTSGITSTGTIVTVAIPRQADGWQHTSSKSIMMPYSRYQRYVRLELEAWVSRRKEEERPVILPVHRLKNQYGGTLYIAAPDKPLTVSLGAGKVTFPALQELKRYRRLQEMRGAAVEKSSALSVSVFYRTQPASPLEKNHVQVNLQPPKKGGFGHSGSHANYFPFEEVYATDIPASVLRQGVQVKVWGDTETWVGQKHRFTLTLPIQREAK